MNAPVELTLADLYKVRDALLKKQTDIAQAREKLGVVDAEAEAAAQALEQYGNASSADFENWIIGDCKGPRPGGDPAERSRLEQMVHQTQHAKSSAAAANRSLDLRDEAVAEDTYQNDLALEYGAAAVIEEETRQLRAHLDDLRAEVAAGTAKALAIRDFFQSRPGHGSQAFNEVTAAAKSALGLDVNGLAPIAFATAERADVAAIEAQFTKLMSGE